MNGIKGWTILGLTLASLLVMAGCSGGGSAKGTASASDDNDDGGGGISASGGAGGSDNDNGGDAPGFEPVLLAASLGVAGLWTARRLRKA